MDAALFSFNWLMSNFETGDEQPEHSFQLSEEEQVFYNKIVHDLLVRSQPAIYHPTLAPQEKKRQIYGLIFRQSESWLEIENKLNKIKHNSQSQRQAEGWINLIQFMRGLQKCIQDYKMGIQDLNQEQKGSFQKSIVDCQTKINQYLLALKKDLDLIKKQSTIFSDEFNSLTDFIRSHWPHLTVFGEWIDVSMDEKKLHMQVCRPKNPIQYDKLGNPKKEPDADYETFLNKSTQAIFVLEEQKPEEKPWQHEEVSSGIIYYANGFNLIQAYFDKSLKVKTDKLSDDYQFTTDGKKEVKSEENMILGPAAVKLEKIVQLAIKRINQDLSQQNAKEFSAREEKGKQTSSNTQLMNFTYLLSSLKPFITSGK